jgi:hypothetical protein
MREVVALFFVCWPANGSHVHTKIFILFIHEGCSCLPRNSVYIRVRLQTYISGAHLGGGRKHGFLGTAWRWAKDAPFRATRRALAKFVRSARSTL